MSKKNFKKTAASLFLSKASEAQEGISNFTQEHPLEATQEVSVLSAQEATLHVAQLLRRPIQTQGRKNKKKPRINMAFEPDIYSYIKAQAELQDKSMTQVVNDILFYDMMQKSGKMNTAKATGNRR